jgi:hypothetical protein
MQGRGACSFLHIACLKLHMTRETRPTLFGVAVGWTTAKVCISQGSSNKLVSAIQVKVPDP